MSEAQIIQAEEIRFFLKPWRGVSVEVVAVSRRAGSG